LVHRAINRYLVGRKRNVRLRHAVTRAKVRGYYDLTVPEKFIRKGRSTRMAIRVTSVVLDMVDSATDEPLQLPINVVDVREVGTRPRNAAPIHWRLLTNRPIESEADVAAVLHGYTQCWKIEELHRTWKSGEGDVSGPFSLVQSRNRPAPPPAGPTTPPGRAAQISAVSGAHRQCIAEANVRPARC
jgi:hypothetical protein